MSADEYRAEAKRLRAYAGCHWHAEADRTTALNMAESYELLARVGESLARLRKEGILC
jgi:hypothetical protein